MTGRDNVQHHTRGPRWISVLALVGVIAGGCGRDVTPEVKGRVLIQGQPVTEGAVVFESGAAGISLSAKLRVDGSFVVASYEGLGLPPGKYQVSVRPPIPEHKSLTEIMQPVKSDYPDIPQKYRHPKTSGLTAEIRADVDVNEIDIDMQREP